MIPVSCVTASGPRHVAAFGHSTVLLLQGAEAWDEIEYKAEEFTEAGDALVVDVFYDGRGKESGVRTQGRFWYVFRYRNGRLWRWELYPERTQALEATGLSE